MLNDEVVEVIRNYNNLINSMLGYQLDILKGYRASLKDFRKIKGSEIPLPVDSLNLDEEQEELESSIKKLFSLYKTIEIIRGFNEPKGYLNDRTELIAYSKDIEKLLKPYYKKLHSIDLQSEQYLLDRINHTLNNYRGFLKHIRETNQFDLEQFVKIYIVKVKREKLELEEEFNNNTIVKRKTNKAKREYSLLKVLPEHIKIIHNKRYGVPEYIDRSNSDKVNYIKRLIELSEELKAPVKSSVGVVLDTMIDIDIIAELTILEEIENNFIEKLDNLLNVSYININSKFINDDLMRDKNNKLAVKKITSNDFKNTTDVDEFNINIYVSIKDLVRTFKSTLKAYKEQGVLENKGYSIDILDLKEEQIKEEAIKWGESYNLKVIQ